MVKFKSQNPQQSIQKPGKQDDPLNRFFKYGTDIASVTLKETQSCATARDFCTRARAHFISRHIDEAILDYQKAISLEPKNLKHYLNLSLCHFHNMDMSKSYETLKTAIIIEPQNYLPYYLFARIGSVASDLENSISHYNLAIYLYKQSPNANQARLKKMVYDFAEIYESIGDFPKALKIYGDVQDSLRDAEFYSRLGLCHFKMGDVKKCMPYFKQSLEINPNYPNALVNLGLSYLVQNDSDTAYSFFNKALLIDGTHLGYAFFYRAVIHAEHENYPQTFIDLDAADRHDPTLRNNTAELREKIIATGKVKVLYRED